MFLLYNIYVTISTLLLKESVVVFCEILNTSILFLRLASCLYGVLFTAEQATRMRKTCWSAYASLSSCISSSDLLTHRHKSQHTNVSITVTIAVLAALNFVYFQEPSFLTDLDNIFFRIELNHCLIISVTIYHLITYDRVVYKSGLKRSILKPVSIRMIQLKSLSEQKFSFSPTIFKLNI